MNILLPSSSATSDSNGGILPPADSDAFARPEPRAPTILNHNRDSSNTMAGVNAGVSTAAAGATTATTNVVPTSFSDNDESASKNNCDMKELMKRTNDQLEASMCDFKSEVKRVFKEIVALKDEYQAVQKIWTPIEEAEHKEAERLDALQVEVDQSMESTPWLATAMNNSNAAPNAATMSAMSSGENMPGQP